MTQTKDCGLLIYCSAKLYALASQLEQSLLKAEGGGSDARCLKRTDSKMFCTTCASIHFYQSAVLFTGGNALQISYRIIDSTVNIMFHFEN